MAGDGGIIPSPVGEVITLCSENLQVEVLALGATLAKVLAPDRDGIFGDCVLGFSTSEGWASDANPCMNCVIGRTAGRIAAPGFVLDGTAYELPGCDGGGGEILPETNLHGGLKWNKALWNVCERTDKMVRLEHICHEGPFPGQVHAFVTYTITGQELLIDYEATATAATPLSITNHAYWNLSAGAEAKITQAHTLQLPHCSSFSVVGADGVPTGAVQSVVNTARDCRAAPVALAEVVKGQAELSPAWPHGEEFRVAANDGKDPNAIAAAGAASIEMAATVGAEVAEAVAATAAEALPLVAVLRHPPSGRVMSMYTSEPCLQTYYSTLLGLREEGTASSRSEAAAAAAAEHEPHGGLCLEAQRHANAENIEGAPSRVLRPGEVYRQLTVHRFSTEAQS